MSLGATIMQVVFSAALTLIPAKILKKDRLRATVGLAFVAIFATCKVGGLLFAAPAAVFLFLFFLWVRFVGQASAGPKRVLFIVTIALTALFLAQHLVHLPIRLALEQAPVQIAANVAGLLLAAAMLGGPIEWLLLRKANQAASPHTAGADDGR